MFATQDDVLQWARSVTYEIEFVAKLWNAPMMGRLSKKATSSSVMVTSHTGRWKLLVSFCHPSTKADINPQSPISNEHTIKELNLVAAIIPSISEVDLQNF